MIQITVRSCVELPSAGETHHQAYFHDEWSDMRGKFLGAGVAGAVILTGGAIAAISPTSWAGPPARPGATAAAPSNPQVDAMSVLDPVVRPAAAPSADNSGRRIPLDKFSVSALYLATGPHAGGIHHGLDLAAPTGTPVYAAEGGTVVQAAENGGFGNSVTIKTADGLRIVYAHLSKILAKKGDTVAAGARIGLVGSTGHSTGSHLHLQVNKRRHTTDPVEWLGVSAKQLRREGLK